MNKLTKVQREILECVVASEIKYGIRKPITCALCFRDRIDDFSGAYARYNKQMFKLLDAGVIRMQGDAASLA